MAAFGFQKAVPLHMNISLFLLSALYYDNIWFGIFLFNVKLMTLVHGAHLLVRQSRTRSIGRSPDVEKVLALLKKM